MKASDKAIALIKHFEGCKLTAYRCPANVCTIGYGATTYESGLKIKDGDAITQERAEELLLFHLKKYEQGVDDVVKVTLNQNQFDALISFAYNLGIGNFEKSRLLMRINHNPDDIWIEREFEKWCYAKGVHMAGLYRRRKSEWGLYKYGELNYDHE